MLLAHTRLLHEAHLLEGHLLVGCLGTSELMLLLHVRLLLLEHMLHLWPLHVRLGLRLSLSLRWLLRSTCLW